MTFKPYIRNFLFMLSMVPRQFPYMIASRPSPGTTENRRYLKPFIEMTKTWLKNNVTFFEGGENKTVVLKKNYAGRWSASLRTMIRMTI